MLPILTSVLILIFSILLAWAGPLLGLSGTSLLVFRIVAIALGLTAAFVILVVYLRERRRDAAAGSLPGGSELNEILREAERRIATAQRTGPKSLATLPLLYILGESNSSKTTIALKSGLDPELIAGQVYRDQDVIATPVANLWYTRAALLVEAGESVRNTPQLWSKLIRRTRPKAIRSAVGQETPVRAAVVCLSSELFLGATASDASLAAARSLNQMLRELALQLGTDIPVYVLLTKLDRIPSFAEFVRNLTSEEASEPFGMPFSRTESSSGLYAEKAMAQVSSVLDQLVFSLGEFRLQLLTRETEQRNIDPVYEFPRELRKLRNNLAACLVELVRPSHLNFNPYLRGLYFTGVRAQVVEQMVAVAAHTPQAQPADAGATRMFSLEQMRAAAAPAAPQMVAQKIAQWCFLPRLVPSVILQDRSALIATSNSSRTHILRRVTFALLSVLLLVFLVCLTISWVNNNQLEQAIVTAARGISAQAPQAGALASEQDLAALDRLRASLVRLDDYKRNGVPLFYTFGLYQGARLVVPAREIYFTGFRRLLLTPTQENLAKFLSGLPAVSKSGDDYSAAYDPLKAYLISTANPDKSTPAFLSPVLMQYWLNGRSPETDEQGKLARAQFDFYASELMKSDPYPLSADMPDPPVTRARVYLNTFGGEDRIYQQMLSAAGSASRPVDFNHDFPGSSATVVDGHTVPAAFTKNAFAPMQNALANPRKYFSGEKWVLGDQAPASLDPAAVQSRLSSRYQQDYIAQWHAFLHSAQVLRYRGLPDASTKLSQLSGPNSALLALLFTASHNTSVPDQQITKQFQPTQAVVAPDNTERFIGAGNQNYINGLVGLQGAVMQVAQVPFDPSNSGAFLPVQNAATSAHGAALQTSQAFDSTTPETSMVLTLLQEPITAVDDLVRAQGPKAANGAGQTFCSAYSRLLTKFPFNPSGPDATLQEVQAVLDPTSGALAQLNQTVKPLLNAPPGSPVTLTHDFVQFYNRLQTLSTALFPATPGASGVNFSVQILPSPNIQNVTFQLDKQVVSGIGKGGNFTWSPQTSQQAQLTVDSFPEPFTGSWALLHLLAGGEREQPDFPIRLDYRFGLVKASTTKVRLELSPGAASLLPGAFAPGRCVSTVAH